MTMMKLCRPKNEVDVVDRLMIDPYHRVEVLEAIAVTIAVPVAAPLRTTFRSLPVDRVDLAEALVVVVIDSQVPVAMASPRDRALQSPREPKVKRRA